MYILFDDFHFCGYTDHPMTPDWPFLPHPKNARVSASHFQSLEGSRSLFYEQIKYPIVTVAASVTIEYYVCLQWSIGIVMAAI